MSHTTTLSQFGFQITSKSCTRLEYYTKRRFSSLADLHRNPGVIADSAEKLTPSLNLHIYVHKQFSGIKTSAIPQVIWGLRGWDELRRTK